MSLHSGFAPAKNSTYAGVTTMVNAARKIDPFDIEPLEKSLNDSATRVSAIWVSYLVFGLYLVLTAGNVTHRQLFLDESIKLPVLNVDLPLVGFFSLAPLLFVMFHAFVLIQVLFLSRTAAAYNESLKRSTHNEVYQAHLRQRLANTLFVQIFAGAPRENAGTLGTLLKLMQIATLVIFPIFVIAICEFMFLPYQSNAVTWLHRIILAADIATILLFWPPILDPDKEITTASFSRTTARISFSFLIASVFVLTFPGETNFNLAVAPDNDEKYRSGHQFCQTPALARLLFRASFDRLSLSGENFVDEDKLRRVESAARTRALLTSEGDKLRNFSHRQMRCADFSNANLSQTDFSFADLTGASFRNAQLVGTIFNRAQLDGADLSAADLSGASLNSAELNGADFSTALLHGANLTWAEMRGTNLSNSRLQGAALVFTNLVGANLTDSSLRGTTIIWTDLRAADLSVAFFHGARLSNVQLQGAILTRARFDHAQLSHPRVGRNRGTDCQNSLVMSAEFALDSENDSRRFSESNLQQMPLPSRAALEKALRDRLSPQAGDEKANEIWGGCNGGGMTEEQFADSAADFLSSYVCTFTASSRKYIAEGLIRGMFLQRVNLQEGGGEDSTPIRSHRLLARGLLGLNGRPCDLQLSGRITDVLKDIAE